MTASVCGKPGCPNLRPCQEHPAQPYRGSSTERGYDAQWRRDRLAHLKREPLCRDCGSTATEADHIVPMRVAGPLVHSEMLCPTRCGLASRCRPCHRRKTLQDAARYPTRGGGSISSPPIAPIDLRLGRKRGVRDGGSVRVPGRMYGMGVA